MRCRGRRHSTSRQAPTRCREHGRKVSRSLSIPFIEAVATMLAGRPLVATVADAGFEALIVASSRRGQRRSESCSRHQREVLKAGVSRVVLRSRRQPDQHVGVPDGRHSGTASTRMAIAPAREINRFVLFLLALLSVFSSEKWSRTCRRTSGRAGRGPRADIHGFSCGRQGRSRRPRSFFPARGEAEDVRQRRSDHGQSPWR